MIKKYLNKILTILKYKLNLHNIFEELASNEMSVSSPIEQVITSAYRNFNQGHFCPSYKEWRMKRIMKMLEVYELNYFKDKRILELGGGHGDIGAFFAEIGAGEVLSVDGRRNNVNFANLKHRHIDNFKSIEIDLEKDFTHLGKFDIILNMGFIEVINNITNVLDCCVKLSNEIIVETLVCDSLIPKVITFDFNKDIIDCSVVGKSCRPSPMFIENYFKDKGYRCERFSTNNINTKYHKYDWMPKNDDSLEHNGVGIRGFWKFKK